MAREKTVPQALAIPFRETRLGTLEVLLVSLSNGRGWGFPKGGIKKGSAARETAQVEALEEAGVLGELLERPLGRLDFRKRGKPHRAQVFALRVERVLARWEEEDVRRRVWVSITEAHHLLARDELARFLVRLRHRLLTTEAVAPLRLAA